MAFNSRSKQHIFSEINFHADDFAQKRAQKLLRVLDLPANRDLLRYIRTFKLVVDNRSTSLGIFSTRPATGIGERAGAILTGLGRTLKATKRNLLILLARMTSAPLEVLIVETRNGLLDFKRISDDFRSLLLAIRSQSNLKSLHFINVTNLDKTFVVSNVSPTGLQELGLWNVAFTDSPVNGSLVPLFSDAEIANLAGIKHLEWLPLPSTFLTHTFSLQSLPNLISLAVSFPEAVVVIPFCRTLESLDSMIETLEIRKCPIGPYPARSLEPLSISLSHLSKLRSLKLSTTGSPQNFSYIAPHHMAYLLTLGDSSLFITTLTIELELPTQFIGDEPHVHWLYTSHLYNSSQVLDHALVGMPNLRKVILKLRYVAELATRLLPLENRVDTYSYGALELLPSVFASNFIDLEELVDVDEVSEFM